MPAKALRGQKLADELLRVAKIFEGKYRQAFLRSVINVVRDQNLIALINDIESGKFTYGDSIDARLASVVISVKEMETLTSKAMTSSAKITNQVMSMEGSFNVVNDAFIEAAKNLSINLSTSISNSARQSLRGVIEELVSGAIPKSEALRRIMLEVGLLPTHAIAVRNYRATLLGSGTPMPKVKTLTEAYTKRLLKYRADMIARTEVARSIGIGQTEFWKQMQAQGFLPPDANRVWITSIDEKTCEFCGPMNGLVASIGGGWQTSKGYLEYPQASHPHCRCSAGITMSKPKKSQAIYKLEELEWQKWVVQKGESAGHPFRGNQYIRGVSGSRTSKPLRQIKYEKSTPEVLAALALGGGFTFDPKRGQVRAVGVAVAIDKEYEVKVPIEVFKEIGAQIVRDYAQRHIEQLQAPNTHVGAWKSKFEGKEYIYLDISVLRPTLEEAAELGRANDQIGIYELSTYTTWERIRRGSKYYPVTERKLGGRDIRYPDLTAVGKAQTLRGVTFLTLSDILDNNILDEFVSVLANSESVEKGEAAGHPFRGNQWVTGFRNSGSTATLSKKYGKDFSSVSAYCKKNFGVRITTDRYMDETEKEKHLAALGIAQGLDFVKQSLTPTAYKQIVSSGVKEIRLVDRIFAGPTPEGISVLGWFWNGNIQMAMPALLAQSKSKVKRKKLFTVAEGMRQTQTTNVGRLIATATAVIVHEIGHSAYRKLGIENQKQYKKKIGGAKGKAQGLTVYATKDFNESFSESFTARILLGKKFSTLKHSTVPIFEESTDKVFKSEMQITTIQNLENVMEWIDAQEIANSESVEKGEAAGHPFRGNQWVRGIFDSARQRINEASTSSEEDVFSKSSSRKSTLPYHLEKVLDFYTDRGFLQINGFLRSIRDEKDLTGAEKFSREVIRVKVENMDSVFGQTSASSDKDIYLYRGMTLPQREGEFSESWLSKLQVGVEFTDKGFVSTSHSKGITGSFATSRLSLRVIFTIKVPAGVRVMAGLGQEKELILNRGTKFRVLNVKRVEKRFPRDNFPFEIELEVVP